MESLNLESVEDFEILVCCTVPLFEYKKMSEDKGTTSIKVIPFSGKAIDWPVWSEKFLA